LLGKFVLRPISGLFRLIRHWLFNRRDGDGGDEGLIAVQLGEAFGQGAHGGQLVFAELVGPGERAGGGFWIRQGGELGENGVGRMRMKRWWRLLWIVAASVLPAWPGHGVPLCPLPAAPSCSCFGTDPLANGNPIGSGGDSYQYQPLDRLVSRDNGAVLLGYNGDGARVKKTVGGTTTFYLVDDRNLTGHAEVVEEHQSVNGGAATLTAVYTHGLDLIAQRRAGSVRYFSYDGHGSTRLLADPSGAVTDTYLYDAYGTLLTSTGSTPNDYLYCGEQFDPDLGMYYLRARFYQPQTGRFWTMDSWEGTQTDPLSLHKYLYAADDPVNRIDPSGHYANTIEFAVSSNIAIGVRGSWEGARAPTYAGAITAALTVALVITAADVIPDAIEKIKQRRRESKVPYVRYDIRTGMTCFGPGTWVLGFEGASLEWSAAIAVTYFYGVETLYMYTVMARPGDVTPYGLVNGLPQYRLSRTISAPDVILTRIVKKPDDDYQGPF